MLAFDVSAVPARPAVVAGEMLAVTTTLTNRGDAPASVASMHSPVRFRLSAPEHDELVLTLRKHQLWLNRNEPPPPGPEDAEPLAPGARREFLDDLALYAHEGLGPGAWQVTAEYVVDDQVFAAKPFTVVVLPPKAKFVAAEHGASGALVTVQDDERDGKKWVLLRASFTPLPPDATAVRHLERPPPYGIDGVSVAVNAGGADLHSWFAILDQGQVMTCAAGPFVLEGWSQSPKLDVAEPRLLSPGYRVSDGAVFAAVGKGKKGAAVQLATATVTGSMPELTIDTAMKLGAPIEFAPQVPGKVLPVLDADGQLLHLVWPAQDGKQAQLKQRAFKLAGGADKESLVVERERPFLAFDAGALKRGGASIVNALFGPVEDDQFLLHVRARLDGQGKPAESKLALPEGKVDAWGLADYDDGPVVVLAHAGGDLIAQGVKPGWTRLAAAGPGTSHLRALRMPNGELWAEWFDPQAGLRHAMIH